MGEEKTNLKSLQCNAAGLVVPCTARVSGSTTSAFLQTGQVPRHESQENCLRMRLHIIVLVTATLMHGCGAQNIIAAWLRNVGIKYVPPPPREGTCRDCSKSSQVSRRKVAKKESFVGLDNIYHIQARFGFDITPTQATNPCCPGTTPAPTTTSCKCGEEGGICYIC